MSETSRKIDSRDVGRDVIDELAIGDGDSGFTGESKRTFVDGRDERRTSEYTGASRA